MRENLTGTKKEHTSNYCFCREVVMAHRAVGFMQDMVELAALAAFLAMIAMVARTLGA
jgi:hypothetical protein